MRDTVEKLVGDAVATDLLTNGTGSGRLTVREVSNSLVVTGEITSPSAQKDCEM